MPVMNEEIYFRHSEKPNDSLLKYPEESLQLRTIKPRLFGTLHSFLWSIETLLGGTYVEYQLWRGDKLVSKAEVVSWIPQFPFMPKNGLHVGPCITMKDERGRGYYPYLLSKIVEDNSSKECYMIVSPKNVPSTRGVEKAGFRSFATGYRTRLGRYVIQK
jgi:hypothetical protein